MSKRYVPRTMWNDTDTLLETAVESAQQLSNLGSSIWSSVGGMLGFENASERGKDDVAFEAKVILVLKATVCADAHRSRLM
jgi:hypothetical protein